MNAVVATQGMYDGGAVGARTALNDFWHAVSVAGQSSPIKRTPLDILFGSWSVDMSPAYVMMDMMSRMASPYDLNPLDINPLRDLVKDFIDFDKVANCADMGLYISATNVETGRARVFHRHEITLDVVMASACLPSMFKAVEIDGVPYWDGGYMGNPVLFPFIDDSPSADIVIVQINPLLRPGTPRRARDIQNRLNEITFNASLLRDLRTIDLIHRLIEDGALSSDDYRVMNMHMIDGCNDMLDLDASSKVNSEWAFLLHLRDLGREHADRWLTANFDKIEVQSTLDLGALFGDVGPRMGPIWSNCDPARTSRKVRPQGLGTTIKNGAPFRRRASFHHMTGDTRAAHGAQFGTLFAANLLGQRTARIIRTAGGRIDRVRDFARGRRHFAPEPVQLGGGGQQHLRIGMFGGVKQIGGRRLFDQTAQIQNTDAVGHVLHHSQVMTDKQISQAELVLQIAHQVQHLGLHRHIQRGCGFVAHNQLGFGCQCAGDANTLALTA